MRFVGVALGLLVLSLPTARAEEPEPLAVIVHPALSLRVLAARELAAVFTRVLGTWPDKTPITPLNLPQGAPQRIAFDQAVLHMGPEEVAQYWIDKKIRGDDLPPRQVRSALAVVEMVSRTPGAIGYVPASLAKQGVRIVARIRRDQVVSP